MLNRPLENTLPNCFSDWTMTSIRYEKQVILVVCTAAITLAVFIYLAVPSGKRRGSADFNQRVSKMTFQGTPAAAVLQDLANSSQGQIRFRICENLATKPITIRTDGSETLRKVIGDIAVQLNTGINDEAEPNFTCKSLFGLSLTIERQAKE